MPIYLCEECGRSYFQPNLTLGGIYQIWLRHPRDKWPGYEGIEEFGYGPSCELCGDHKTTFMVQFIGRPYGEDESLQILRERFLKARILSAERTSMMDVFD